MTDKCSTHRIHAETPCSQSDEQAGHARIRRRFTANRSKLSGRIVMPYNLVYLKRAANVGKQVDLHTILGFAFAVFGIDCIFR
jgi:hypothetical protein